MRTGIGGWRAMRSANARAAAKACPSSTTVSTKPQSSASAAAMRSDARMTACLVRRPPAGAEVERHDQCCAAADAMALDGGDGDLVHVLPGLAHLGTKPLAMDAFTDRQRIALAAFRVLQVETRREGFRRAGQDHDRGFEIIL